MNKRFQLAALTIILALSSGAYAQSYATSAPGQGTWETTLQGRDLDGDLTNGYEAFYDTALDVTWLNNPSPPWSTPSYPSNYAGTWTDVNNFAKQLNVFGVTGWRIPSTDRNLGTKALPNWVGSSFINYETAFSSELSYLYYVTLGNYGELNSLYPGGEGRSGVRVGWLNSGPFGYFDPFQGTTRWNLPSVLWVGPGRSAYNNGEITSVDGFTTYQGGSALYLYPNSTAGALFVRSGDVGVAANVPEPQTYALVLAGLMVTASAARRRKT